MVCCFVVDCTHHSNTSDCKFKRFPKDPVLRKKWESLIRRKDVEPNADSRVCSCHFKNGNFDNLPGLYKRNNFTGSPEKRTHKRLCQRPVRPPLQLRPEFEIAPQPSELEINVNETSSCSSSHALLNIDVETQTNYEFPPLVYEAEIEALRREIQKLKLKVERGIAQPFGFFIVKGVEEVCLHYTGLQIRMFELLENVCGTVETDAYDGRNVQMLSFRDQLFLCLIKLRLNFDFFDLGKRFGVSPTTAYRIFRTILVKLHVVVFQVSMEQVPSRNKTQLSLPASFNAFSSCRMIIDCTEMRCQVPDKMDHQKITYSNYKKYNSLKVLIGLSPNGTGIYCSRCYGGSTSDKNIVTHSGLLKIFKAGDLILADKGFLISDLLPAGVSVNLPPFLTRKQFTPAEVYRTRNIARARIHVERFNARLKNHKITHLIPRSSFKLASLIIQTCVGLVNYQNPLIKETELDMLVDGEDKIEVIAI